MAQLETQSIPRDQFLTISTNILYRVFLEASRTDAKKVFRDISEGQTVGLTNLQMEDNSTLGIQLSLDHSEFIGRLNYGAFRASLNNLIGNIAKALEDKKEIQTFGADNNEGSMIFGITGLTVEDEQPNVMVLSATMASRDAKVMLRLMYLDPQQFIDRADDESTA